jgi:Thiopurine S-methyltransferase (TPMT)
MIGNSSPALLKLIAEGKIPNGRALIPGCGRGYDVVALASKNRIATGIFYSFQFSPVYPLLTGSWTNVFTNDYN